MGTVKKRCIFCYTLLKKKQKTSQSAFSYCEAAADRTGTSRKTAAGCCAWLQMLLTEMRTGGWGSRKVRVRWGTEIAEIKWWDGINARTSHNQVISPGARQAGRYMYKLRWQRGIRSEGGLHVYEDNQAKSDCWVVAASINTLPRLQGQFPVYKFDKCSDYRWGSSPALRHQHTLYPSLPPALPATLTRGGHTLHLKPMLWKHSRSVMAAKQ